MSKFYWLTLWHKSSAQDLSTYKGSFYINLLIFCPSGEQQKSNNEMKTWRGIPALTWSSTEAGRKPCPPLTQRRHFPNFHYSWVQVLGWSRATEFISGAPVLQDFNILTAVLWWIEEIKLWLSRDVSGGPSTHMWQIIYQTVTSQLQTALWHQMTQELTIRKLKWAKVTWFCSHLTTYFWDLIFG